MAKRTQGSHRRLDHVDRRSQIGVSAAMRARDVSRPTDEDADAAQTRDDGGSTGPAANQQRAD